MKKYSLAILMGLTILLRIINLGYSDFQGDEIKALYIPDNGTNFSNYLLDQRKGPTQFFVTALVKLVDADYQNRFLVRLPFALAGIAAVYFFYKFIEIYFGDQIALISAFFFSTNGFLVAFSRIVQYQSFVILFMIMALYFFSLSLYREKWSISGLYLGFICWALSFLSHYDGLFIFPFVLFILGKKLSQVKTSTGIGLGELKHLFGSAGIFLLIVSAFYLPFVLNITQATKDYWFGRITGGVSTKNSSSRYLFSVYQPIYVLHIYTLLGITGLVSFFYKKSASVRGFLVDNQYLLATLFWAIIPLIVMEVLISVPGTHIYTYLIPSIVIMAYGLNTLFSIELKPIWTGKVKSLLSITGVLTLAIFVYAQSYAIYVDNKSEYPWEEEKFAIWTFPKPTPSYHLSLFGFPYYRFWDEVGDIVNSDMSLEAYGTNERTSISRYHVLLPKETNIAGYYVYIINPQSFENDIAHEKAAYWIKRYAPVITFRKNSMDIVRIYKMPQGGLEIIKAQGY